MSFEQKHNNTENDNNNLPDWQRKLIDRDLQEIADHPERLRPIDELFAELDRED